MSDVETTFSAPWESIPDISASSVNPEKTEEPVQNEASDFEESEVVPPEKAPLINEIALEFIGFWNRLISQTNWEKGKVIQTWRTRLIEAGFPRSIYSDESIAQRIGNISSQHVGRLRRVFERFGDEESYRNNDRFQNLFWSHYQAALDWEDAERWLDKASAEGLSVAQMRIARWEEYGAPADKAPKESEIISSEPDEDVNPRNDSDAEFLDIIPSGDPEKKEKKAKRNPDIPAESSDRDYDGAPPASTLKGCDEPWSSPAASTGEILQSMNEFPALPSDLADPIESLKDAVLNHKVTGWNSVPKEDILKWLGAIRSLILSEE